jgi:hypothetical protein
MGRPRQAPLTSGQPDDMLVGVTTPDELERQVTLRVAVARYDELRLRDSLSSDPDRDEVGPVGRPLDRVEALELLALGEIIARKAAYGRQLAVRTARAAGASWSQIGLALGATKQSAWEGHNRWIQELVRQHENSGYEGLDELEAAQARQLAGDRDERED